MLEEWADIATTGYQVSSLGNVFTNKFMRNLKLVTTSDGYKQATIKGNSCRVHRLVMAYLKPIPDSETMYVNHINGNKSDNRLDNLEWCTPQENVTHAIENGLTTLKRGKLNCNNVLTVDEVIEIKQLKNSGIPRISIAECYGVHTTSIRDIWNGKSWNWVEEKENE